MKHTYILALLTFVFTHAMAQFGAKEDFEDKSKSATTTPKLNTPEERKQAATTDTSTAKHEVKETKAPSLKNKTNTQAAKHTTTKPEKRVEVPVGCPKYAFNLGIRDKATAKSKLAGMDDPAYILKLRTHINQIYGLNLKTIGDLVNFLNDVFVGCSVLTIKNGQYEVQYKNCKGEIIWVPLPKGSYTFFIYQDIPFMAAAPGGIEGSGGLIRKNNNPTEPEIAQTEPKVEVIENTFFKSVRTFFSDFLGHPAKKLGF